MDYPNYFDQSSERLTYRKLEEEDIKAWESFFHQNDRLHYLGMDLSKDHKTLAREWVYKQFDRYAQDGIGALAVCNKETNELIALGGLLKREIDGRSEIEIAYSIIPRFWKLGYGTEIARQLKRYGIQNKVSRSFISIIHIENKESMHVATKNGMNPWFETQFMEMPVIVFSDAN